MCCLLIVSYPRLPTPGGRIFGSFTTTLFEPGTSALHRSAQYLCPNGKWQTMPLPSASPASCSPDFPSAGPRDLWPGPGGSTSGFWTRWGKAPVDVKTSLRPLLSGSPFLFSKQEKQFSGPSTTWCCFGASYREESPPPLQLFWGRGRSPASETRIGCGRGTVR